MNPEVVVSVFESSSAASSCDRPPLGLIRPIFSPGGRYMTDIWRKISSESMTTARARSRSRLVAAQRRRAGGHSGNDGATAQVTTALPRRRPRGAPLRRLYLLAFATALHLAGAALFGTGFLSTRVAVPGVATCPDDDDSSAGAAPDARRAPPTACPPPAIRRVVALVIDALRYDFVFSDGSPDDSDNPPPRGAHVGRLARLRAAVGRPDPRASRAFRFVADPPTTTAQRIKALATGGLPAFVELGSSLAAGPAPGDSLVTALARAGRPGRFVGDDVWAALFPDAWDASPACDALGGCARPMPSFDVADLDSVDDGVMRLLPGLIRGPEGASASLDNGGPAWGLAVGHFLGVDHAGHVGRVDSPAMLSKLDQTDARIEALIKGVEAEAGPGGFHRDTLVVVMGDHGMTEGGDHGGESREETDSFLWVYHPGAARAMADAAAAAADPAIASTSAVAPATATLPASFSQIDLAPTLASALGVPAPLGTVGGVRRSLLDVATSRRDLELGPGRATWGAAAPLNAPVSALIAPPRPASPPPPPPSLPRLHTRESTAYLVAALESSAEGVVAYMETLGNLGGPLGPPDAVPALRRRLAALGGDDIDPAALEALLDDAAALARQEWSEFKPTRMALGVALVAAATAVSALAAGARVGAGTGADATDVDVVVDVISATAPVLLVGAHAASFVSNSFVLEEGPVTAALAPLALSLVGRDAAARTLLARRGGGDGGVKRGNGGTSTPPWSALALAVAAVGLAIRLGRVWEPSEWNPFANRRGAPPGPEWSRPWACSALVRRMTAAASLASDGETSAAASAAFDAGASLVARAFWAAAAPAAVAAVLSLAAEMRPPRWVGEGAAVGADDVAAAASAALSATASAAAAAAALLADDPGAGSAHPAASRFAFGAALAAAAAVVAVAASPRHRRVAGPLLAAAAIPAVVVATPLDRTASAALPVVALVLLAGFARGSRRHQDRDEHANTLIAVAAAEVSAAAFFATGHRCEVPALHLMAGYAAFPRYSFATHAPLLALETLGHCLWAPLLAGGLFGGGRGQRDADASLRGLAALATCRGALALASVVTCAVHRRHLMVWGLFAPKAVFECAQLAACCTGCLLAGATLVSDDGDGDCDAALSRSDFG